MCLAVPMKVVDRRGELGRVEQGGVTREASFTLLPQARPGDYVLVHAGFAIERLDQQEAEKTLQLLQEMLAADGERPEEEP